MMKSLDEILILQMMPQEPERVRGKIILKKKKANFLSIYMKQEM